MSEPELSLEEEIEQAATEYETFDQAQWATKIKLVRIVNRQPAGSRARGHLVKAVAARVRKSVRTIQDWAQIVALVPEDLHGSLVDYGSVHWAVKHIDASELAHWLRECHDNNWTLKQLQAAAGKPGRVNLTTPTVRRVLRSLAADLPAAADTEVDPEALAALEQALAEVVAPFVQPKTNPPPG